MPYIRSSFVPKKRYNFFVQWVARVSAAFPLDISEPTSEPYSRCHPRNPDGAFTSAGGAVVFVAQARERIKILEQ